MRYVTSIFAAVLCVAVMGGDGAPRSTANQVGPRLSQSRSSTWQSPPNVGAGQSASASAVRVRFTYMDDQVLAGDVSGNDATKDALPFAANYGVGTTWSVDAGAPADDRGDFTAALAAARKSFHPTTAEQLSAARKVLNDDLAACEKFLATNPDELNGWKEYLHWKDIEAELARGPEARPAELRRLGRFFQSGKEGMEQPEFIDLVASINEYAALLEFSGPEGRARERFNGLLDEMSTAAGRMMSGKGTTADAETLGRDLGRLQAADQAPALVAAARARSDEPNLRLRASAAFVSQMVNDPDKVIDETDNDFHDEIMGTDICGVTHTTGGRRSACLIPDENRAVFEITVYGQTTAQTTGFHPPVTIESHSLTTWQGHKRVFIDGNGYSAPCCATADACTHTCIDCIDVCGGRLKTRIATKKVYQSKGEAECVAAEHAEERVRRRMDSDSKEGLAQQNKSFAEKFRDPLRRWGAFPQELHYSTTHDALWVRAREANGSHLAAPTAAPEFGNDAFLAVRVHESFVNNLLAASLAGRKVTKREFQEGMINMLGDIPDEQKPPEELTPEEQKELSADDLEKYRDERLQAERDWTITFAEEGPITVEFANNGYAVTIRGAGFQTAQELHGLGEEQSLDFRGKPMNIRARYHFGRSDAGALQAVRDEFTIAPPGKDADAPLSSTQLQERNRLRRQFGAMFPEVIPMRGVKFATAPWRNVGMLIGAAPPRADGGWLSIDWRQATDDEKAVADEARKKAWEQKNRFKVKADAKLAAHGDTGAAAPPVKPAAPEPGDGEIRSVQKPRR